MKDENNIYVLGVFNQKRSIVLDHNFDSDSTRTFCSDGKAIADFLCENLPAITYTIMLRELLNRSKLQ